MTSLCCPRCKHDNRPGARFCAECGQALARVCPKCGADASSTARFCDACGARLEAAGRAPAAASTRPAVSAERPERRQMTVMFCDLADSTALARRLDPEVLRQLIRTYQDICTGVIRRYDGYISRYMGDGILVLFGYPRAHDDDPQRAARAALDIVAEIGSFKPPPAWGLTRLSVRAGIATGLVVAGDVIGELASTERAIVGETPNLAARLQSVAEQNTVLLSSATYRLLRHSIPCRPAGRHDLKGYPEPVDVYQVIAPNGSGGEVYTWPRRAPTPLVGRDAELDCLRELWGQVEAGAGHVVLVQGEAGIGKSRLVREFQRECDDGTHTVLELRCSPYFTSSALYPVVELLRRLLGVSAGDTRETVLAKVDAATGSRARLSTGTREQIAVLLVPGQAPGFGVAPPSQRIRARPHDAIVSFFLGLAQDTPLLLTVEDLHWVDPSTLQVLELLVDQVPLARILVVATTRPEFRPEWSSRSHAGQLNLSRLMPSETDAMVTALTVDRPLPESLRRLLVEKTDGVPLFIEELTQTVMDVRLDPGPGNVEAALAHPDQVLIPVTLRDSLMARLDRLGNAKSLAQLAAVIGRTFSYPLLKAVAGIADDDLRERLGRLVTAELLYQQGVPPDAVYHFKHSLIQDIAYDSLLNVTRREFHGRIAAAIEAMLPEVAGERPELVARHYTLAVQEHRAVELWKRAGEIALQRAADVEAISHARQGLRLIPAIERGRARDELELALQVTLGAALSATEGYAVAEVEQAFNEALRLCRRLDARSELFPVLRGLHSFYLLRGPLSRAKELGAELIEIADTQGDAVTLCEATRCLGWTLFCAGEMVQGTRLIRRAVSLYDQTLAHEHTRRNVSDAGGVGLINMAWMSWFLGDVERSVACGREAVELARQIEHPFTLAYALCMGAAVHQCRREPEAMLPLAEEAVAIGRKHSFRYWIAWGTSLQGWANALLEPGSSGTERLEEGHSAYCATGALLFQPYILGMLAETLARAGEAWRGLELLERASATERERGILFYSAETWRLTGELRWSLGDGERAVACVQEALDIAHRQGAKSLELRAATSLLRMAGDDDRAAFARKRLNGLLESSTTGPDTADHREARQLL